jgi:hypothetical protein
MQYLRALPKDLDAAYEWTRIKAGRPILKRREVAVSSNEPPSSAWKAIVKARLINAI